MKLKLLSALGILTLITCNKLESTQIEEDSTEALIQKTDSALKCSEQKNKDLDSLTTVVVKGTTKHIDDLHEILKTAEQKPPVIKTQRIYKRDTIYVIDTSVSLK